MTLFWLKNATIFELPQEHLKLLSREIKNAIDRIPPEENEYYDMVVGDVCDFIEESLGIGFVIAQRTITSIVSQAKESRKKLRDPFALPY